jgi:hypothetical protein
MAMSRSDVTGIVDLEMCLDQHMWDAVKIHMQARDPAAENCHSDEARDRPAFNRPPDGTSTVA